jgi:hypothetical protein
LRYSPPNSEADDKALLQYESLRCQVLNRQEAFTKRSLGLALFIRRGMLAWTEVCHQCISADSPLAKQPATPVFSYEIKSEMIKVMANITLSNLKEAH